MFVGDDPPSAILSKSESQTQTVGWILAEFFIGPATQQSPRKGYVLTGYDFERENLERCSPSNVVS